MRHDGGLTLDVATGNGNSFPRERQTQTQEQLRGPKRSQSFETAPQTSARISQLYSRPDIRAVIKWILSLVGREGNEKAAQDATKSLI